MMNKVAKGEEKTRSNNKKKSVKCAVESTNPHTAFKIAILRAVSFFFFFFFYERLPRNFPPEDSPRSEIMTTSLIINFYLKYVFLNKRKIDFFGL